MQHESDEYLSLTFVQFVLHRAAIRPLTGFVLFVLFVVLKNNFFLLLSGEKDCNLSYCL